MQYTVCTTSIVYTCVGQSYAYNNYQWFLSKYTTQDRTCIVDILLEFLYRHVVQNVGKQLSAAVKSWNHTVRNYRYNVTRVSVNEIDQCKRHTTRVHKKLWSLPTCVYVLGGITNQNKLGWIIHILPEIMWARIQNFLVLCWTGTHRYTDIYK